MLKTHNIKLDRVVQVWVHWYSVLP